LVFLSVVLIGPMVDVHAARTFADRALAPSGVEDVVSDYGPVTRLQEVGVGQGPQVERLEHRHVSAHLLEPYVGFEVTGKLSAQAIVKAV
jgi:hypothetical protein